MISYKCTMLYFIVRYCKYCVVYRTEMWPFENASSLLLAHWFDIHIDICCQLPMPLATAATSKCPTLLHLAHGDMVTWWHGGWIPQISSPKPTVKKKTLVQQPAACPGRCSARPRDLDQTWERLEFKSFMLDWFGFERWKHQDCTFRYLL